MNPRHFLQFFCNVSHFWKPEEPQAIFSMFCCVFGWSTCDFIIVFVSFGEPRGEPKANFHRFCFVSESTGDIDIYIYIHIYIYIYLFYLFFFFGTQRNPRRFLIGFRCVSESTGDLGLFLYRFCNPEGPRQLSCVFCWVSESTGSFIVVFISFLEPRETQGVFPLFLQRIGARHEPNTGIIRAATSH